MHCENTASTAGTDDSGADGKEKKRKSCSSVSADEKSADGSFASKKIKVEDITSESTSGKVSSLPVSKSAENIPEKSGIKNFDLPLHGQKIEVQWDIHQDDGKVKSLWWGATHIGASEEQSVGDKKKKSENVEGMNNADELMKDRLQYEILYQASHGFESEKRLVTYIDEHILFDVVEQDYLYWRFEGKEWMPQVGVSANEYVGQKPGYEKLVIMSAEDLVEDQHRFERDHQNGVSVEQLGLAAMNTLPHQQQVDGALAYRSFADKIKMKLAMILKSKGANYVVTKNDVETIMEQLKKEEEDRRRM